METDIRFKTRAELEVLAAALELSDVVVDSENYWMWVIGTCDDIKLDITRTHTRRAAAVLTRIFRVDGLEFEDEMVQKIRVALRHVTNGAITVGQWRHTSGESFDMKASRVFDESLRAELFSLKG